MKIAIIGTRGVPARYGGFETAVEEIGAGLADLGHEVVVYCRGGDGQHYRGMRRVVLPAVKRKALETITHSGLSALHAVRHRPDVALVFNAANAPYVALLRAARIPTVLHLDGHDERRAKWRGIGSRYYSWATRVGPRRASRVIVDSRAVQREFHATFGVTSTFIPYGASETQASPAEIEERLESVGLRSGGYHLVVARFEPENHVLEIVQGYSASSAELPLVVVGFQGYPGYYAEQIVQASGRDRRVHLMGPVWDQDLLDAIYAGAASYVHGHSVGGTNPSLLRAMVHSTPVLAYDCPYNRETMDGAAQWWADADGIAEALQVVESDPGAMVEATQAARKRVAEHYIWPDVVANYEKVVFELQR